MLILSRVRNFSNQSKIKITLNYNVLKLDNIQIKLLTPKYLKSALHLAEEVFFSTEKVCKAFSFNKYPEAVKELLQIPEEIAKDGISIVAVQKSSDKVVAASFNKIHVKDDRFFESILEKCTYPISRGYLEYYIGTNTKINLFEATQSSSVFESVISYTALEYQQKGLSTAIHHVSEELMDKLATLEDAKIIDIDGFNVFLKKAPQVYIDIPTAKVLDNFAKRSQNLKLLTTLDYGGFKIMGQPISHFVDDGKLNIYWRDLRQKQQ